MITTREYDLLCKVTDDLRTATEALYTAGISGDIKEAARQFVVAEDAWEAFTIRLVEDTAAETDGWIEWRGGVCPVASGVEVEARHRGLLLTTAERADSFDWGITGSNWDIISYRVVS